MIKIGEYQELEILRELPQGYYLVDEEDGDEVLLPRSFITRDMKLGDKIKVFIYCDSEGREVATTEKPWMTVGEYALLEVSSVTSIGAFCGWGTSKELLIPFHNQKEKMEEGKSYVVHMYLDDLTDRLVGTTKLSRHLEMFDDDKFTMGEEVDLIVFEESTIGYKVVVNQTHGGLVYKNELAKALETGQELKGYIKPKRPDKKLDISLNPIGYKSVQVNENIVVKALKENNGFLPFNDKSDPEKIKATFGISKKLFKKIIGGLYKEKTIRIESDGIHLVSKK